MSKHRQKRILSNPQKMTQYLSILADMSITALPPPFSYLLTKNY